VVAVVLVVVGLKWWTGSSSVGGSGWSEVVVLSAGGNCGVGAGWCEVVVVTVVLVVVLLV